MYRLLRKRLHLPAPLAYLLVWCVSAVLHGAGLLATGSVVAAGVFTAIFLTLGGIGSYAVMKKNQKRKQRRS